MLSKSLFELTQSIFLQKSMGIPHSVVTAQQACSIEMVSITNECFKVTGHDSASEYFEVKYSENTFFFF